MKLNGWCNKTVETISYQIVSSKFEQSYNEIQQIENTRNKAESKNRKEMKITHLLQQRIKIINLDERTKTRDENQTANKKNENSQF